MPISKDKPKNAPELRRIEYITSLLIPAARDFLHQSKQKKAASWKFVTGCACLHMREQNLNSSEIGSLVQELKFVVLAL